MRCEGDEMIWVDDNSKFAFEKRNEPYGGCMVVMNVGADTPLTKLQQSVLRSQVDKAHAKGWLVIYAFDSSIGVSAPPQCVEAIPDMDMPALAKSIFGREDFDLLYKPHEGKAEFVEILSCVFAGNGQCTDMAFDRREGCVMGFATVDGKKVFIPPVII